METIIRIKQSSIFYALKNEPKKANATFWKKTEESRFAIIPMLLVVIGCLGGIAAAYGAQDNVIKLAMVAFPTIITLAFTIAVSPMRLIVYASCIAAFFDLVVFAF